MTNGTDTIDRSTEVEAPKFEQLPQLTATDPEPESMASRIFQRIVWILFLVVIRVVVHAMFR